MIFSKNFNQTVLFKQFSTKANIPPQSAEGYFELADPPDLFVHNNADKVDKPNKRSKEEHNDGNHDSYVVLNVDALNKTVDSPHDVKHRDTKDKLYYKRKLIHSLEKIFHQRYLFYVFSLHSY